MAGRVYRSITASPYRRTSARTQFSRASKTTSALHRPCSSCRSSQPRRTREPPRCVGPIPPCRATQPRAHFEERPAGAGAIPPCRTTQSRAHSRSARLPGRSRPVAPPNRARIRGASRHCRALRAPEGMGGARSPPSLMSQEFARQVAAVERAERREGEMLLVEDLSTSACTSSRRTPSMAASMSSMGKNDPKCISCLARRFMRLRGRLQRQHEAALEVVLGPARAPPR